MGVNGVTALKNLMLGLMNRLSVVRFATIKMPHLVI